MNLLTLYIIHEPIMALVLKLFDWGKEGVPIVVSGMMFVVALMVCLGFIWIKAFVKNLYLNIKN